MAGAPHAAQAASHWVRRWTHLLRADATVLDVACGSGRHVRWFAQRGRRVTGVDRDAAAVAPLHAIAEIVVADIEGGPWPFASRRFDAVVVTNYLWRERLADVIACVAEGGVLIYETFAAGHEAIGKPSNPKFLLRPGELLEAVQGLRVVAFEDGFEAGGEVAVEGGAEVAPPRFVQRIVAVRERTPGRHLLHGPSPVPGQVKSVDSEDLA
jgi:SAM-dependent methyltransferase